MGFLIGLIFFWILIKGISNLGGGGGRGGIIGSSQFKFRR